MEILILPDLLKLVMLEAAVADRDAALTLPPVLNFNPIFPFNVLDLLSLQIKFDKIALHVYRV